MFQILKERFAELSQKAKIFFALGLLCILGLFIALSLWVFNTNYQILFADLDPQDASAIVAELDRAKKPYKLDNGGKTILVDESIVYKTRLELMSKNVNLKGTVGFEIFNESDFGMTDFAQKINYQRALQGEIARTIMGLEEVHSARVHIVTPQPGFLKREEDKAKASVTIAMKPGYKLATEQVTGIQKLVAAAIPDIEPSLVTVIDNRGIALNKPSDGQALTMQVSAGYLELKEQLENYLIKKVATVLDRAIGPGRGMVSIDATLDFDSLKITKEELLPIHGKADGEGAIIKKKIHTQRNNIQNDKLAENISNERHSPLNENTSQEVEYAYGRKVEHLVNAPGALKRLSVGIVLPSSIDLTQQNKLAEVISMTIGLNRKRGDELAIYPVEKFISNEPSALPSEPDGLKFEKQIDSPTPQFDKKHQRWQEDKNEINFIYILTPLLALLCVAYILLSRQITTRPLTQASREKTLAELQEWLNENTATKHTNSH